MRFFNLKKAANEFTQGAAFPLLVMSTPRTYPRSRNGFVADRRNLQQDARQLGNDMRQSIEAAYGR